MPRNLLTALAILCLFGVGLCGGAMAANVKGEAQVRAPAGAKVQYQHHGIWLARHGYVALLIDTIEFGEISGIHHGTHNLGKWYWLSLGYTPAGPEIWNAIRALDYLETRPEVDPKRYIAVLNGSREEIFRVSVYSKPSMSTT